VRRANDKPGARTNEQTGPDNTQHLKKNYTSRRAKSVCAALMAAVSSRIWVLTYTLEEARQRYADRRQLLRQAAVCLMLVFLRLVGLHHA